MKDIIIYTPLREFSFYNKLIDLFQGNENMELILTEINPNGNICDFVLGQCTILETNNKIIIVSKQTETRDIFGLIYFVYQDSDTLMKIFNHYDGSILAFNDENILKINIENSIDELKQNIYVLTGYSKNK